MLLTATHEESTREKLRRVVGGSLIGASQLGHDEQDKLRRSGLISSQIMRLAMMRVRLADRTRRLDDRR